MSLRRGLLVAASLIGMAVGSTEAQNDTHPQFGDWGLDLSSMDPAIIPGDDFNLYASGAWLVPTAIPPDKPIISLRSVMSDLIEVRLHELMEQAAASMPIIPVTLQDKVGAFYKSFVDEERIEALGVAPIGPELAAVRAAPDHTALAALMGRSNKGFEGSIFSLSEDVDLKAVSRYAVYVGQAGLGLPDRDYYLEPSFAAKKTAYQAYVAELLTQVGWPDAEAQGAAVVAFKSSVAQASWTAKEQRDLDKTYNPMTRAELEKLAPKFPWDIFFESADLANVDRVIVMERSALPRIATIFATTTLEVLQAWQAFRITDNSAFYLAKPLSQARFGFRNRTLLGQP